MSNRIRRLLLTFLALGLFATQAIAQQQGDDSKGLVGTYQTGHRFGGSVLTLTIDGSYELNSRDCSLEYVQSGSYFYSGKVLHFQIQNYIAKGYGAVREINLFDPSERKEIFGSGSDLIKKEFELVPVKWSDRIYLIDSEDLSNFANAVNFGLEPRAELSSEPYYGSFFLREGDQRKRVSGKPAIPEKWRAILLRRPVVGTVVRLKGDASGTLATLNKGSNSGLRVGMRLLTKKEEPSPWSRAEIVSVTGNSAIVRTGDRILVGDKLTTKYAPPRFYR